MTFVTGGAALCPGEACRSSSGLNQGWVAKQPTPYTLCGWPHGGLGFHQYGLIAVDPRGDAMQLEKVTYDVAKAYLPADFV